LKSVPETIDPNKTKAQACKTDPKGQVDPIIVDAL
jgi:hypothetical protein